MILKHIKSFPSGICLSGSFFRKGKPLSRLRRQLPWQGSPWQRGKVQEHAGSFSEDRPLGWDPVAAGNRAGDGMACNNNDRRQWRNQGIVVGAAASKTQAQAKRMLGAATRPRVRRESSPSGDGDKSPLKILTSAPVRVIIHKDNMVCGWFRARNYGAREVFYYGTY